MRICSMSVSLCKFGSKLAGQLLLWSALFTVCPVSANELSNSEEFFLEVDFFYDNKGMHTYPGLVDQIARGLVPATMLEHIGFVLRDGKPIGFTTKTINGWVDGRKQEKHIGVISCAYCHTGKAAGIIIPGLANKSIDLRTLGYWGIGLDLKSDGMTHTYSPELESLITNSQRMFAVLENPAFSSPTVGLIDNNILKKTFFQAFGLRYDDKVRAFLNKPGHLWGLKEKKKLGLFWGGEGSGHSIGWKVGPEIMNGQTAVNIRKKNYFQKVSEVENHVEQFQPPKYPFEINENLAFGTGKSLFTGRCQKCHGDYQKKPGGSAIYQVPKLIPWRVVKTDPNRSKFFDSELWSAIEESEFSDLLLKSGSQDMDRPSYIAPRLEGVWSRFPYLHNASVPTLMDLLTTPESRPVTFSLKKSGEKETFDQYRVGLKVDAPGTPQDPGLSRAWVYDVKRPGQSNQGHAFGIDLSEKQKLALIEYLKTL